MNRKVGLWIDHAKAVVVSLDDGSVTTRTILSEVGKRPRMKGGARSPTPYGPQDATYEARRDRKYAQHLKDYYDRVISATSDADAVLIMGPGEARSELEKRLAETGASSDSVSSAPSDKLTEAQIVEKVKLHYGYRTRESF